MMKAGVILICLLASDLVLAITVKPNKLQPTAVENRSDHKKVSDGERIVRYIPQHFSPSSQRHHLQLDNLNLVRYLQSLPKATPQIPSIAYLYGSGKHHSPQVQAGFIYKARTQNYSNNHNNVVNKDSYPVGATMYPSFNRPSIISEAKYPIYTPKPQAHIKVKQYSPFSPSNKIPGPWLPINYKPFYGKVVHEDSQKEHVSPIHTSYETSDEEEFIPIPNPQQYIKHMPTKQAPPPHYVYKTHNSNKIHPQPEKSISILNPAVPAAKYEAEPPLAYVIAKATTTTTERPILITTEHTSLLHTSSPRPEIEFEEQLIYKLPVNKSTVNIEHTTRINYIDDHVEDDDEPPLPLPYGPIELYQPKINLTKIAPVPNEFTYYKMVKNNPNPAINSAQKDYYDKDIDNDYDDGVKDGSPRPGAGRPGIDYPILHEIPETSFNCKEQRYKGFFGDVETGCQVWHYCDLNGGKSSFLCPNGTIFSQHALTCDWWFNVKCATTAQLYVLNERLYKFILPFSPKFPQDFQGPLVDKYLAIKFEEMEEKLRKEKEEKANNKDEEEEESSNSSIEDNEIDEAHYGTVEGEFVTQKPVIEDPPSPIEIVTKAEEIESTEAPQLPLTTTIIYDHEQQLQSIEPEVEIKNVGASGHLTHHVEIN